MSVLTTTRTATLSAVTWLTVAVLVRLDARKAAPDAGMTTAEYAVGTVIHLCHA